VGSDPVLDHTPREGVRTFTPRWRNSSLTDERMATLLPARSLPDVALPAKENRFLHTGLDLAQHAVDFHRCFVAAQS